MAVVLIMLGLALAFIGALFRILPLVGVGVLLFIAALFIFARSGRGSRLHRGHHHSRERTRERTEVQDGLPSRFKAPRH